MSINLSMLRSLAIPCALPTAPKQPVAGATSPRQRTDAPAMGTTRAHASLRERVILVVVSSPPPPRLCVLFGWRAAFRQALPLAAACARPAGTALHGLLWARTSVVPCVAHGPPCNAPGWRTALAAFAAAAWSPLPPVCRPARACPRRFPCPSRCRRRRCCTRGAGSPAPVRAA